MELNIVTNFSIIKSDGKYFAPVSEGLFINEICKKCDSVKLNSFVFKGIAYGKAFEKTKNLNVNRLNKNLFHYDTATKLINYIGATNNIFQQLRKDDFWYIFIPGNISLIFGILGIIRRRKYAVYVRGDWKRRNIFKYFYNLIIRLSKFALVEGSAFTEEIKHTHTHTYEVVPIMQFGISDCKIKNNYQVKKDTKLLFVGRIEKDKGIFEMLCAIRKVLYKKIDIHLTIVGETNKKDKREIEAFIKNLNLELYVRKTGLIGNKQELEKYYKDADIFIFPSRHEGFPRVIYEAMLFSLPIICTRLPGVKGILKDMKNCLFVGINDEKDLEEKISLMASNQTLRENLGKQALIDAIRLLGKFSKFSHASQFYELFKKEVQQEFIF